MGGWHSGSIFCSVWVAEMEMLAGLHGLEWTEVDWMEID